MRLSVGSLHLSIAENILQVNPLAKWVENEGNPRWELENIGRIDNIILMKDSGTGHSKGYGFITTRISFCHAAVVLLMKRTREQGPSGHQALNRSMALNLLVDLGELAM